MSFSDLKGQDGAVSFLKNSLAGNKLSHAYIFSGPRGVGKFLAAMNFTKAMICQGQISGESCDKCPSCKKVDSLAHPDVFLLKPEKDGGSIKIDDVRQLIKDAYLKPFEAKKKVFIIDDAKDMKHEAANALLKTLEEPPADSVLILITDDLKALFHTIVSRSQVVRFYPLKPGQIKDALMKKYSVDEAGSLILSRLASGSLGEALKYKDEDVFQKRASLINSISSGSLAGFSFDDLPKDRIRLYLDILLSWFADILSAKAGADDSMLVNIDKKDIIVSEAKRLSFEYLEKAIDSIISTISYLDQNANQKLAMSVLALKVAKV